MASPRAAAPTSTSTRLKPTPHLPLKIENPSPAGGPPAPRGRLSSYPQPAGKARPDMNANVAMLEPQTEATPCAQELTRINESLQARERLLPASASARLA